MKGLFIPEITAEMFRNGCLEGIEALMAEGEIYDIDYEPEQRWIPCSERLPEEDFWKGRGRQFSYHVLVTIVNHENDDEQFTDMAQTVDGIWQLSHDVDGDCSLPNWCEVIAWMPLPEPYKGADT